MSSSPARTKKENYGNLCFRNSDDVSQVRLQMNTVYHQSQLDLIETTSWKHGMLHELLLCNLDGLQNPLQPGSSKSCCAEGKQTTCRCIARGRWWTSEGVSSNEFNQLVQWAYEIVMQCLIHIPAVVNDSRKHARQRKKRKVLSSANTANAFIHFLPWLPQISYLSLSHSQCQFKCRVYCSKHWLCVVTKLWIKFSSETSHFSWSDSRSRAKPDTFERL